MNKKQRQHKRAVANGEVYVPPRKPAMPCPKIVELRPVIEGTRESSKKIRNDRNCSVHG